MFYYLKIAKHIPETLLYYILNYKLKYSTINKWIFLLQKEKN